MQHLNDETKKQYLNFIHSQRDISTGQHKIKCPECHTERTKNKNDRPFSVNVDHEKIVFNCFHCGINGILNLNQGTYMQSHKSISQEEKNNCKTKRNEW